MSQITHLLVERLQDVLIADLQTPYPEDDLTRANEIHAYRFQKDPTKLGIHVAIYGGNPDDIEFRDGRVSEKGMENLGMVIPYGEIGGGHYWWRRGRVQIGCYYVKPPFKLEQEIAADYAHIVLGRVTSSIEAAKVADIIDEFGEQAQFMFVPASTFAESGGPPNSYIWRGVVHWQALTRRP